MKLYQIRILSTVNIVNIINIIQIIKITNATNTINIMISFDITDINIYTITDIYIILQ